MNTSPARPQIWITKCIGFILTCLGIFATIAAVNSQYKFAAWVIGIATIATWYFFLDIKSQGSTFSDLYTRTLPLMLIMGIGLGAILAFFGYYHLGGFCLGVFLATHPVIVLIRIAAQRFGDWLERKYFT